LVPEASEQLFLAPSDIIYTLAWKYANRDLLDKVIPSIESVQNCL